MRYSSTMKYIHIIVGIFVIVACNKMKNDKNFVSEFPIIQDNLIGKLKIASIESFNLIPDFNYPRHSYIVVVGNDSDLMKYVEKIGLIPCSYESISKNKSTVLHEYNEIALWNMRGYQNQKRDSLILKKLKIEDENCQMSYAAYFNSGLPNRIFKSYSYNWNGKIAAKIMSDTCVIFIEELKHPLFKRVND